MVTNVRPHILLSFQNEIPCCVYTTRTRLYDQSVRVVPHVTLNAIKAKLQFFSYASSTVGNYSFRETLIAPFAKGFSCD